MINTDDFIYKLWNTYKRALKEGYNQKVHLIINRTDYMLDKSSSTASTPTSPTAPLAAQIQCTPSSSSSSSCSPTSSITLIKEINYKTRRNSISNDNSNTTANTLHKQFSTSTLKQVEINTMSSGFGYVSSRIVDLHR